MNSFINVYAPKPIRSKNYITMNSIKNYSKTPMGTISNDNLLFKEEYEMNFHKKPSNELNLISLDEIKQDFFQIKAKSELSSSNDEILKILSTPKTMAQSIRSFDYNNDDINSNDNGIERAKNPIYKAIEGKKFN